MLLQSLIELLSKFIDLLFKFVFLVIPFLFRMDELVICSFPSFLIAVFLFFIQVSHVGVSNFSILAVIAVFSALLADLFLLPALCRVLQIRV